MKKILLGLVVGLLIGTAGTALAASDFIQAEFAKFNLVVNGEKQELKNEPLVVNDTTYWPLRELSEYTGLEVDYIEETRTIVVNTPIKEEIKLEKETTEVERLELGDGPFNVDAYNTIAEIDARLAYLNELLVRYIRDDMAFNQSRARAEISMLERKRATVEETTNPVEEKIDLATIEFRIDGLKTTLLAIEASLTFNPTGDKLEELLQMKREYESEIAELEAKLLQLQ